MDYQVHTTKQGIRIILIPNENTNLFSFVISVGVGSGYENSSNNGISHFLEHMLFRGTKNRKNSKIINKEFDLLGAFYNAYTSKDKTVYYATVESKYATNIVDLLLDMYLNSQIYPSALEKEKGAILEEINMYEDSPADIVDEIFEKHFYGPSAPLGRNILGPKENIKNMQRQQFFDYMDKYYTAENTTIAISGKFNANKLIKQIEKATKHIRKTNPPKPDINQSPTSQSTAYIHHKNTDQTHLLLGMQALPYGDKLEFAQITLNYILGQVPSSRLYTSIREERGLAYNIYSFLRTYQNTRYLGIYAGVSHNNTQQTISTILTQLNKLSKYGVSEEELIKAKRGFKTNFLINTDKTDYKATLYANSLVLYNKINTTNQIIRKINSVNKEDIKAVSKIILNNPKTLAIIGPHKSSTKFRTLLK